MYIIDDFDPKGEIGGIWPIHPKLFVKFKFFFWIVLIILLPKRCQPPHIVNQIKNIYKYFLAYKFSQDHLELLFGCIWGKNDFNNNPGLRTFVVDGLIFREKIKNYFFAKISSITH